MKTKQKKASRLLSGLCALAIVLTLLPATRAAGNISFPDVQPGDWYYDTVMDMVNMGVVNGYPDGAFRPDKVVSMVEFCKMALAAIPGDRVNVLANTTPEALRAKIEAEDPDYWGNDVIYDCCLRGFESLGTSRQLWNATMNREYMALFAAVLYQYSNENPPILGDGIVTWMIGDYLYEDIEGSSQEDAIIWAYSNGIVGGVNEANDFDPHGSVTRAVACTILSRICHPEQRLPVDLSKAQGLSAVYTEEPTARLEDGADFTGMKRIRYSNDIAFDYARRLEREIGIQIFYLPEFADKPDALITRGDLESLTDYFFRTVVELRKLKAAYDVPGGVFEGDGGQKERAEDGDHSVPLPHHRGCLPGTACVRRVQ